MNTYNHGEAFCHMWYLGATDRKRIQLRIWNSRDGVTPFMMYSQEYGLELQHANWNTDIRDVNYKPKKSDLIWKNYTQKDAEEQAAKEFNNWLEEKKALKEMTDPIFKVSRPGLAGFTRKGLINQLTEMTKDFNSHVEKTVKQLIERSEPLLELVKEDWK